MLRDSNNCSFKKFRIISSLWLDRIDGLIFRVSKVALSAMSRESLEGNSGRKPY